MTMETVILYGVRTGENIRNGNDYIRVYGRPIMQETQQVEEMQSEFISLSEFIPNWTYTNLVGKATGHDDELEKQLGINIAKGDHCIVGEAHGGDNYNDCKTCHFLSYGDILNNIISPAIAANGIPEEFMKFKKELYSHMIDEHPEKMRR